MTKRKLKKAIKRLRKLPGGLNLLKYATNKIYSLILKLTKSTRVAYPSSIMIEVTNHCNLKCFTCPREYAFGINMDKGYINLTKLKKLIDEVHPYLDSIGLTGLGETFLNKEIIEIVKYIRSKNKGVVIFVSTNAHVNDISKTVSQISNELDTIQISIDGLNETYEQIRKNGSFAKFLKNLRELVKITKNTDTDIMFNMVVIKENYTQMAEIVEFAHHEGVKYVNITPMNLAGIPEIDTRFYEFYKSVEFKDELKRAINTAKKYPDLEFTFPNLQEENNKTDCPYLWGHFYITWDGYLVPCCAKPFPKILNFGNVLEEGLLKSLNSPGFRNFREQWQEGNIPEFCEKCLM